MYRVSQEERSVFWEIILVVSAILSKKVYMYMCPIPNGSKIDDKKEILPTVSNTGIYCSSDSWYSLSSYNTFSKIPLSTSMSFATRVRTWRVVRLSAS
jgi:hypothetical protein